MRIEWIMLWSILNVHCACAEINETLPRFTSVDFKTSDQHKYNSSTKTQLRSSNYWLIRIHLRQALSHSILLIYSCTRVRECWHAAQLKQKILDKMTAHRVSDFVFKKSNHVVAPASTHPVKATSETMSVNLLLLLQQYIFYWVRQQTTGRWA